MLRRAWLVVVVLTLCFSLQAQTDSLSTAAPVDTLGNTLSWTSKAVVLSWIDDHHASIPGTISPILYDDGIRLNLYRFEHNYLSRPVLEAPKVMGFMQPVSYFTPGLYHGAFSTFYPRPMPLNQDYGVDRYPYEPALSVINGGIGEYEHHFARLSLMKNCLLGVPELYYQGDLLAANGLWADVDAAETSHKHYLSIPLGRMRINAEYANWNRDVSMLELLPAYWSSNNFLITHRMHHQYLSLVHPQLTVSLLQRSEQASSGSFYQSLQSETTQLMVSREVDWGTFKYNLAYEHKWQNQGQAFDGIFEADNYQDKLSFVWDSYPFAGLNLDLQLLDWKRAFTYGEVMIPVYGSYIGASSRFRIGEHPFTPSVADIYSGTGTLDVIDKWIQQEHTAKLRVELGGLSTILEGGLRSIRQQTPVPGLTLDKHLGFTTIGFDLEQSWGKWLLQADPCWSWQQQSTNMCENPEFTFSSVQNLILHLPWGNSIKAGFQVQGHSGYYAANALNPALIEGSTTIDTWLGIGIESRFDLSLGIKNLLSSNLYGSAPAPVSLFADLTWYYLN